MKRPSIFARGVQDMKCIGMMYLEAIDYLKNTLKIDNHKRNIYIDFVPDEEIGGGNGNCWFEVFFFIYQSSADK